jgi:hypothetical protein
MVGGYFGINHVTSIRAEPRKGAFVIDTHERPETNHVDNQNSGQPAFDPFRGQSGSPQPHGPNRISALRAHSNGKREGWHFLSVKLPVWFTFSVR